MTPSQSKMRAHGAGPGSDAECVAFLIASEASRKDGARIFRGWTNPDASSIKENTHRVFRMVAGRSFIIVKTTRKSAPSCVRRYSLGSSNECNKNHWQHKQQNTKNRVQDIPYFPVLRIHPK